MTATTTWTVVIRKNNRGQFQKTGFVGTWSEADIEARRIAEADPTLDVWYVATEDTTVTLDNGRVVTIAPTAAERRAAKERQAEITRQAEDMLNSWLAEYGYLVSDARVLTGSTATTPRAAAYALAEAGWTRAKLGIRHS